MSAPLETAKLYFELSDRSDMDAISDLMTETTTYSSATTGIYLGRDSIIDMQRKFHGQFSSLKWNINSAEEVKPGICLFDFDFVGRKSDGDEVRSSGLEYVIVHEGMIQHVEIRNKS